MHHNNQRSCRTSWPVARVINGKVNVMRPVFESVSRLPVRTWLSMKPLNEYNYTFFSRKRDVTPLRLEDSMFSKLLSPPCWLTFEWVGERDEAFETFVCDVFWRSVTTSEGKMTGTLSRRLLRRTKLCLIQFLEWTKPWWNVSQILNFCYNNVAHFTFHKSLDCSRVGPKIYYFVSFISLK